jgi:hypothetical protein
MENGPQIVKPIRDEADRQARSFVAEVLKHKEWDRKCAADPLYWLQHHAKTRDDHWKEKGTEPYAHFPSLPYLPFVFHVLRTENRLLIAKSRDMLLSWSVIGYLVWVAQWHGPAHIMIQTQKEDKARDLVSGIDISGYVRTLYEQQEPWMQMLHPTPRPPKEMAGLVFTWTNGSKIEGVPSGAEQIRQYHPRIVFFDEAAFLDSWLGSWNAAEPVASQMIAVSSAYPSDFGDMFQRIMGS